MSEVLVNVYRGKCIESIHRGDVCVVCKGKTIYNRGNTKKVCFLRSAAKPFILLSNMTKGIADKFNFTYKELSVMASSHSGSSEHIKEIYSIIDKLGITKNDIKCGIRRPFGDKEYKDLLLSGNEEENIHNNCSGKHLGIIAACIASGHSYDNYQDFDHAIQKDILKDISIFSNTKRKNIYTGLDGCGVPVFAVPLKNSAIAYSRLFNIKFNNGLYKKHQKMLYKAINKYPYFLAGENRFDTCLIKTTNGRVIGKMGSEGFFGISIPSEKIGITLKIEDGNLRAIPIVVCSVLKNLCLISKEELKELSIFYKPMIRTSEGVLAGFMEYI